MSEEVEGNAETTPLERAQAVKRAHERALLARANVVGVGIGLIRRGKVLTEQVGIIVMVSHKRPPSQLAAEDLVPKVLEGVPVDVQEVGEIRTQ